MWEPAPPVSTIEMDENEWTTGLTSAVRHYSKLASSGYAEVHVVSRMSGMSLIFVDVPIQINLGINPIFRLLQNAAISGSKLMF